MCNVMDIKLQLNLNMSLGLNTNVEFVAESVF